MQLKDFDYNLSKELIAQAPAKPRDHSRLLILERKTGQIEQKYFYDIIDYLHSGDVLVLNNTKVFPARLLGEKEKTGGKMEVFLLRQLSASPSLPLLGKERVRGEVGVIWQCLLGGRGGRAGLKIIFGRGLIGEVLANNNDGTWQIVFNKTGDGLMRIINKIGHVPLPPYIKRSPKVESRPPAGEAGKSKVINDKINYQTIYADQKKVGSVAAPTAGFHFTPALLKKIKAKGVQIEYVTLHVGLGTFAPVKVEDITRHKMHSEWIEVEKNTLSRILKAKHENRRVVAVGTTSVRALESVIENYKLKNYLKIKKLKIKNFSFWTNIFIYPGYKFKVVDGMITNFHLPKSTLLMLVSALAGKDNINRAYQCALREKYRFFSYGDAMLII